jgi:phosphate:Na+ symporter
VDVAAFAPQGGLGVLLCVALGFLMTVLTQSSSAAIALTLTAASGGALALDTAAAMVIGANVGTTSTAALATIGATANARRVAAAHMTFNLVTAVAALLALPVMLWASTRAASALGLAAMPAVTLALFHTLFNVLGVALMWPLTPRLTAFLGRRFVTRAETVARPAHLDRTVLVTPALAMEALELELLRAMTLTREAAVTALRAVDGLTDDTREQLHGLGGLLDAVSGFVAGLGGGRLPPELAGNLPLLLRICNYLEDVIGLAAGLDRHHPDLQAITRPPVVDAVAGFQAEVVALLARCRPDTADFDRQAVDEGFTALQRRWHDLKTMLLTAASRRELPLGRLNGALEALRLTLRMAEQLAKAALRMETLRPAPAEIKAPAAEMKAPAAEINKSAAESEEPAAERDGPAPDQGEEAATAAVAAHALPPQD